MIKNLRMWFHLDGLKVQIILIEDISQNIEKNAKTFLDSGGISWVL